ncbi:UMP-CMP kinase 2, mitochondrial [Brienomyrus brachyistius]|uniref:UMP-CMP kinase 2, mitochondrial n=1 Tax=Brienomyrus brachyistius TaxID=42636 RepID=UPI0020B405E5|nr:UMP-CMP kinase 2, mitochondrial [Brienomyrus brachyistius]
MSRRALSCLSHWSSRLFAIETNPAIEPVYFSLIKTPPTDAEMPAFQEIFRRERSYSFHVCVEDRIQRALFHDDLRHELISRFGGDAVFEMSSFRPNVKNSLVKGFFVNGVRGTPETEQILSKLLQNNRLAVCTYVPGEGGGQWRQELLCPAKDGAVAAADSYGVAPVPSPDHHPSAMDIINSSVFYSFLEAHRVMAECAHVIPEAQHVLQSVDLTLPARKGDRFPVIVIEGLDATGKTTLTESLKESLGGVLLRSPPLCLSPWRACFDAKPALFRRAFYALGNYVTAAQISAESARAPVIVDRYWHSTAAYGIGTAVSGKVGNLPGRGSEVYRWPGDLLRPDLVLLLTVSPEERLRRLTGRGGEKTREEVELEANQLFRSKVEEAYRRMEDPACVVVDASPSAEEVLQQVLLVIKDKVHLRRSL